MRTDSTVLSNEAVTAARRQAGELYGPEYVPDRPRVYANKSKNAQEAHEAIRPAGDSFRTPAQVSGELRGDEFRLYELIWKRTVASQMADARGSTASVRLVAAAGDGRQAEFAASGTVITFRGFLAAYEEGRDEDRNGEDRRRGRAAARAGRRATRWTPASYRADGHQTAPPPRYTEASLVKALEERGIGRPSTYAATISVIQDRGYVTTKGNALVPDLAGVRGDPAARGALRPAGRLRLHRLDGGGPRPDRRRARRSGRPGCPGSTSATATTDAPAHGDRAGRRRAQAAGRRPRRDRRPGHQLGAASVTASCCGSAATGRTWRRPASRRRGAAAGQRARRRRPRRADRRQGP